MGFNKAEQEAIILNAAWSMIDEMVNYSIFPTLNEQTTDITLVPKTAAAKRLFSILLNDFLSPLSGGGKDTPFGLPVPKGNPAPSDSTFLFYLKMVADDVQLGSDPNSFGKSTNLFSTWLEEESHVPDVWLPTINLKADLSVQRKTWIKIVGNISKHNFTRLQVDTGKIAKILKKHGHHLKDGEEYLLIPEFQQWFYDHLLSYHIGTLAEFLNNIRIGIFEYLETEFARSYQAVEPAPMYRYKIPKQIQHPLAQAMYWDLMNRCRAKPWLPCFSITPSLKGQF